MRWPIAACGSWCRRTSNFESPLPRTREQRARGGVRLGRDANQPKASRVRVIGSVHEQRRRRQISASARRQSCRSEQRLRAGSSKRGKTPGKLCKVSPCFASHSRNSGGFPPLHWLTPDHAAPACPGFCPSYWFDRATDSIVFEQAQSADERKCRPDHPRPRCCAPDLSRSRGMRQRRGQRGAASSRPASACSKPRHRCRG